MREKLRAYRIEIKYILIAVATMAIMALLAWIHVFDGVEKYVNAGMDDLAQYGLVGMFVIGLFSNMTLVIQVPYNLPMFSLVIYADGLGDIVALGVATAIGAGIGATMSYAVAHTIVSHVDNLDDSALFRTTRGAIERRPYLIPLLVFLASATPVPDFSIIVPLAMVRYPWQKMLVPMVIGKIFHNVGIALLFRFATERMETLVSGDINFDLTSSIVILFVLLIFYQVEKARATANGNNPSAAPANASARESVEAHPLSKGH